ncbi:MAG: phosphopentomutase, partial [Clostridia bacterium]|nr:phosphopentomutase [Clostridia bacterium]
MKRIFLIVLDSFGIGEAPDACDFGDVGANTLKSIAATGRLDIPNLTALGLGNIDGITSVTSVKEPYA